MGQTRLQSRLGEVHELLVPFSGLGAIRSLASVAPGTRLVLRAGPPGLTPRALRLPPGRDRSRFPGCPGNGARPRPFRRDAISAAPLGLRLPLSGEVAWGHLSHWSLERKTDPSRPILAARPL